MSVPSGMADAWFKDMQLQAWCSAASRKAMAQLQAALHTQVQMSDDCTWCYMLPQQCCSSSQRAALSMHG